MRAKLCLLSLYVRTGSVPILGSDFKQRVVASNSRDLQATVEILTSCNILAFSLAFFSLLSVTFSKEPFLNACHFKLLYVFFIFHHYYSSTDLDLGHMLLHQHCAWLLGGTCLREETKTHKVLLNLLNQINEEGPLKKQCPPTKTDAQRPLQSCWPMQQRQYRKATAGRLV